jgi:GR25 family glycosyltransferase involved in LPS biosynthesis
MSEIKTVVISLIDSPRRKDLAERLLVGGITKYEIVDAQEPHRSNFDYIQAMTYGEHTWTKDSRLKNNRKNEARQACYISHVDRVLWEAKAEGLDKILILEDDIKFKSNLMEIINGGLQPTDALISFYDSTHIEIIGDEILPYWEGHHHINTDLYRVWCAGCYLINDVNKVYDLIIKQRPRVYDKLLVNIQKTHPCYIYFPPCCYQDRKSFDSNIS